LGLKGGDLFLIEVASRIVGLLRSIDTVSHYSGDEFVLVISNFENDGHLVRVLDELLEIIRKPFRHEGNELYSGASIGVTVFPDDAQDAHDLILKAEQAMYVAKKSGKNDWNFYRAEMQEQADFKNRLYNDLVRVIETDQLQVFFQPIIDATTLEIAGCESLVRWHRNESSWVNPEVFIDIAEERGLVCTIDYQVLIKAIEAIRTYNRILGTNIYLSVNASPKLLDKSESMSALWLQKLRECDDMDINIEITERVLMGNTENVLEMLNEIRANGKGLSLDDFGTGYSGLSYITRYPINTIKIDRSFVSKMISSEKEKTLVESMLVLARKLKMKVVAEGVETEEEYRLLSGMGSDYLQGYYFANPMPLDEFIEFSRTWKKTSQL
jgi:predicted signal transduction protein with EAL and GGDEF domain